MKKSLFLITIIFIFFTSLSFVCSAEIATTDGSDSVEPTIFSSTAPASAPVTVPPSADPLSSVGPIYNVTNNSGYKVVVSYGDVKQGEYIIFTVRVTDNSGSPVVGRNFGISFRGRSDTTDMPAGYHTNVATTNSNGVITISIDAGTTAGWFDVWDFTVSDGLNDFKYPIGNIYYYRFFDFTIKSNSTVITFDISKPTIYEGQFTEVTAYVTSNGVPVSVGYLLWEYGSGKTVATLVVNGISIFNYNSYLLGNNLIDVTYIGFGDLQVIMPGLVISQEGRITKSFSINVLRAPDLVIYKVVRVGNKYKITVKNVGKAASAKTRLKLGYSKKKYKLINVAPLGAGKSKIYTINFFKYAIHKKFKKYAWIDYNKAVYDKDFTNNKINFKSNVVYGYCADLAVTNVSRHGNNYVVTIKNKGKAPAPEFKLNIWFGSKSRAKNLLQYPVSRFGQFGKKLPSGVSIILTVPYIKHSIHAKYSKFIQVNPDRKFPETNYKNNIKRFKI